MTHSAERGRRAVVLLSGGLDSATAAALARREGFELYGLTVGTARCTPSRSPRRARVAAALGFAQHREIDVDLGASAARRSSATARFRTHHLKLRTRTSTSVSSLDLCPGPNTVLLSLALAWAEVLSAERIVIGVNALDYSGYPDCRPEFIAAFEYLASLATKAGVEGRRRGSGRRCST